MNKLIGFFASASVTVGVAVYFIQKNPTLFDSAITWIKSQLGMP